jgi:hypothetical protein
MRVLRLGVDWADSPGTLFFSVIAFIPPGALTVAREPVFVGKVGFVPTAVALAL